MDNIEYQNPRTRTYDDYTRPKENYYPNNRQAYHNRQRSNPRPHPQELWNEAEYDNAINRQNSNPEQGQQEHWTEVRYRNKSNNRASYQQGGFNKQQRAFTRQGRSRSRNYEGQYLRNNNPPHNIRTQQQNQHPMRNQQPQRFQTEQRKQQQSNNPDFKTLWRTLYQKIQLMRFNSNWESGAPKSLKKSMEDFFDNINPPAADSAVRTKLNQLRDTTLSEICTIMAEHTSDKLDQLEEQLTELDQMDIDRAKAIAKRSALKQYGRRIRAEEIDKILTTKNKQPMDTGVQTTPPRRNPDNNKSPIIPTAPAFASAAKKRKAGTPPRSHIYVSDSEITPPGNNKTIPDPPMANHRLNLGDSKKKSIIHHTQIPIRMINEDTECIILTDSNGAAINTDKIPEKVEVHVARGLQLQNVPRTIPRNQGKPKTLVVQAGVNNHNNPLTHNDIEKVKKDCANSGYKVFFVEIPIPPKLREEEEQNLIKMTAMAKNIFGQNFYIPLPAKLQVGSDGYHLTTESANTIFDTIVNFL